MKDDRLARLQAAERRANWRDYELKYGNNKRHPYGVTKPRRTKKQANPYVDAGLILLALVAALWLSVAA